jgi:hypothetical protein
MEAGGKVAKHNSFHGFKKGMQAQGIKENYFFIV